MNPKIVIRSEIDADLKPPLNHDYPLHEFSEAEKIYDTNSIQNLVWSIC